MGKFKFLFDYYLFFSIIVLIMSGVVILLTKKYSKKRIKTLGFFLDLSKSQCILLATNTLHVITSLYCVFRVENFGIIYITIFITNCVIAIVCSLNLHYAIAAVIYDSITIIVLILLSLVKSYLIEVRYDSMINILSIVFSVGIITYLLYTTTRKTELMFKKS